MKLDIVVPHYKEPWSVCHYLFDTISTQRGIDFEDVRVIFVNDGMHQPFEDVPKECSPFAADPPFKVLFDKKQHEGVSAARNYGLKMSDADYVMFCDCDDGFLNNYALYVMFAAMKEEPDLIVSDFLEETYDVANNRAVVKHDQDLTFMHGKLYKRQFLLDHDLLFDESMTIHEDGYFNMVVYATAQHEGKIKPINTATYLWCWNDNSTVRRDREDFVLKTYEDVMKTRVGLCRQLKQRGYEEDYRTSVCMTVLNSYYDFQKTSYSEAKNARYRKAAEKAFKRFWEEFKSVFLDLTNQKIAEVARVARENACKHGMLYEQVDLRSFLKYIEYQVK